MSLTFDDGWADTHDEALEVLLEFSLPAMVYATTGFIDRPDYMTSSQVRELVASGIELGCHTATHPDLRQCDDAQLKREVAGAKRELEDRFGVEISSFAYPSGLFNTRVREAVKAAGFETATTCRRDWVRATTDPLLLGRNVMESVGERTFAAAVDGGFNFLKHLERVAQGESD